MYGSILQYAAAQGDAEMVRLLVQEGARVNAKGRLGGRTPLATAAAVGNRDMVQFLLDGDQDGPK